MVSCLKLLFRKVSKKKKRRRTTVNFVTLRGFKPLPDTSHSVNYQGRLQKVSQSLKATEMNMELSFRRTSSAWIGV